MNRSVCGVMVSVAGLAVLGITVTLAGVLAGSAMAQAPDAGCALPSGPEGIPAAIDAAITGPADKDRACTATGELWADDSRSFRSQTAALQCP